MFNQTLFMLLIEKILILKGIRKNEITTLLDARYGFFHEIKIEHQYLKPAQLFKICKYLQLNSSLISFYCDDSNYTKSDIEQLTNEQLKTLLL